MPKPLVADWDLIKSLILKGLTPKQVSEQTGISHEAIRKRAQRSNWDKEKAKIAAVVSQAVQRDVTEGQKNYLNRVIRLGDRMLDVLEQQENYSLEDLEAVAGIITKLDPVQRRALGLDVDGATQRHQTLVQVVIQQPPSALPVEFDEPTEQSSSTSPTTIDVETVSTSTNNTPS